MIVLDASAALELPLRAATHERLVNGLLESGELLAAPHLLDLEIARVLRRFAAAGELSDARASCEDRIVLRMNGSERFPLDSPPTNATTCRKAAKSTIMERPGNVQFGRVTLCAWPASRGGKWPRVMDVRCSEGARDDFVQF